MWLIGCLGLHDITDPTGRFAHCLLLTLPLHSPARALSLRAHRPPGQHSWSSATYIPASGPAGTKGNLRLLQTRRADALGKPLWDCWNAMVRTILPRPGSGASPAITAPLTPERGAVRCLCPAPSSPASTLRSITLRKGQSMFKAAKPS